MKKYIIYIKKVQNEKKKSIKIIFYLILYIIGVGWRSGTKSYQNQPESVSSFKRILKSISNLFILSQHRPIRGGAWWVLEKIYSIVISKRGTFSEVSGFTRV